MHASIYVHFPFCVRKCLYCDFASYPGKEDLIGAYVEALKAEIRMAADRFPHVRIPTVYFGGGTPNLLAPEQLADILDEIRLGFQVDEDAEITLEANPAISHQQSAVSSQYPVSAFNRLSLGMQSFHDSELRRLGRIHTAEEAVQAFRDARSAGFGNISVDLMYGIPEQTPDSWRRTLDRVIELRPEHVSLYSLTIETGTPFFEMQCEGRLELPGTDIEADMYESAIEVLTANGFVHYEISNFARPGFESRHNINYWKNRPYFGFGSSASSFLEGIRAVNISGVEDYIRRIESGETPIESEVRLTGRRAMGETMFLGLRMLSGVDAAEFRERYGVTPQEAFPTEIRNLLDRRLIEVSADSIRLSRAGFLLANEVFAEFV